MNKWLLFLFFVLAIGEAPAAVVTVPAGSTENGGSIGERDRQNVYGTANNVTVSGMQEIFSGGAANGSVINLNGNQFIRNGGLAANSVISGGGMTVLGGTADNPVLYDGLVDLDYGTVNNITMHGGVFLIYAGGAANGLSADGGKAYLYDRGYLNGDVELKNSSLSIVGNNTLDNLVMDNAQVSFMSFFNTPITVRIGSLQGNGRFDIRTNFSAGQNDVLDIARGSGRFGLAVADYSSGSRFPDQIDLLPKTPQNQESFYLVGGAMDIGAHQYVLAESADRWYLQRTYDYTDTAVIAKDTYATLNSIFYAHLQNIYARLGEFRMKPKSGMWARGLGRRLKFDLSEDSKTDIDVYGVQFGADYAVGLEHLKYAKIGISGGYTNTNQKFERAGKGSGDTYSVSLYSTLLSRNNSYLDMVAAYYWHQQHLNSRVPSGLPVRSKYHLNAYSLSAETGHRFELGRGCFAEPQAQLYYMDVDDMNYRTSLNTPVKGENQNSVLGRIGLVLGKNWQEKAEVYVSASVLHELDGKSNITVADKRFDESIDGTFVKLVAGADVRLAENFDMYASIGTMFGDSSIKMPVDGSLGLRWQF